MHIWMSENNKKREGELMIITKDVLKNLKLKKGEISEKRCQEINAMKIKNPYYPWPYFSCEEEYFTIRDRCFVHSEDERIVYINAFHPLPVLRRESSEDYDDIFIMVIDNEYVSVVIDYINHKKLNMDYIYIEEVIGKLKDDVRLDKRPDKENIIYLIEEMDLFGYNGIIYGNKEKHLNLEYKGELYKWKHWNE
jgi:hypothetical protein